MSDVIGFWVVGVPLGYWLAMGGSAQPGPFACFDALLGGGGARGIWTGFATGVGLVAAPVVAQAWAVGTREEKPIVEEGEG